MSRFGDRDGQRYCTVQQVVKGCEAWLVMVGFGWAWLVIVGYGLMVGHGWLWLVMVGYGW